MKRTPMPRPTKPLARATPVKATNPKRKRQSFARAYGSPERVAWMQAQPCLVCGQGGCENAHVGTGGMGRKSDACQIVPLCHRHHAELHAEGRQTFEGHHRIDLAHWAAVVDARWEASHPQPETSDAQ